MLQKKPLNARFPKVFEPGYIGKLQLKNRLVRAPCVPRLATPDGYVTQRTIAHYRELARGGAGLVIVECSYVDDIASQVTPCEIGISRGDHRPGLTWLATTIKANGAKAGLQLVHAGVQRFTRRGPVKSASPVPWVTLHAEGAPLPEELTVGEIKTIINAFGAAALRSKSVGFDMVEVHAGHGYLISNFLSPHYNKRTDLYGGDLKNRMRFLLEVVDNIRQKTGPDYPLSIRLSGVDHEEESPITMEETIETVKALEKASVDAIHMSGGDHEHMDKEVVSMYWPQGYHVWCAEEAKKVLNIPVIAAGGINSPELAENILEEGKADFIGLGRPLFADPCFPLKAEEGRPEDIRPCIRCGDCQNRGIDLGSVQCAVNVALGNEDEFKMMSPAVQPKKVAVIGGGPAGMECATVAALRRHEVTLFEKRRLGGMLVEASFPDFKADIRRLINYLSIQVKKAGVKIVEGKATSQIIKDGRYDVAVVATGGMPWFPNVAGADKPFVIGVLDVLHNVETGKNVIIVGGGMIACDVALFLAEKGKKVTITTRGDKIARDMTTISRLAFFERLRNQDVEIRTGVHLDEIVDGGIVVSDRSGVKSEIKGDTVVLAGGLKPNRQLFDELVQLPELEVYAIGDCVEPRTIFDAIHEGHWVGRTLGDITTSSK